MPPKRKKRSSTQTKSKTEGSSSSESEYSRTLEIITRLSQKYLSTNDAKKKQTSTEVGYDGDEENSTGVSDTSAQSQSSSSSTSSSSMYDFDEPDYVSLMDTSATSPRLSSQTSKKKARPTKTKSGSKNAKTDKEILKKSKTVTSKSKSPKSNKNKKTEPTKTAKSSFVELKQDKLNSKSSSTPSSAAGKSVTFTPSNSVVFSNSPVVSLQRLDLSHVDGYESFQRPLRKRKCETVDSQESNAKSKIVKTCEKSALQSTTKRTSSKRRDSGVIMSPPSSNKIPMLSPTDTSTPSIDNVKANFKKCKAQVHSTEKLSKQKQQKTVVSSTPAVSVGRQTKLQRSEISSRNSTRDMNDSNFGFDSIETPSRSIDLSPVPAGTPITPTSDYASMSLDTPSMQLSFDVDDHLKRKSTRDDSFVPELFSEDIVLNKSMDKTYKSVKPLKRKRKAEKKVHYKPKIDKIAERLNDEFEEIEKFQLSIEDM